MADQGATLLTAAKAKKLADEIREQEQARVLNTVISMIREAIKGPVPRYSVDIAGLLPAKTSDLLISLGYQVRWLVATQITRISW